MYELMVAEADNEKRNADRFIQLVKAHTEITELTFELVREFIEKISIGQVQKKNGQKEQEVTIVYNFIGVVPEECKEG